MVKQNIIIAIDGHSSTGKSSTAKEIAKRLEFIYIDTGAMYRGVALYALRNACINNGVIDKDKLIALLDQINLEFRIENSAAALHLNGENISSEIRGMEVTSLVSHIAKIKEVRDFLVRLQREMGQNNSIVMDGRDIGTIVFPNADLKIFMTASADVRAMRRWKELDDENVSVQEVKENLMERDYLDTTRAESPLIQAKDAKLLDNSDLSFEKQIEICLDWANVAMNL